MEKLNVVISGCFTTEAIGRYGRNAVRETITAMGHNVRQGINKSTDYLVIGTANVPGRGVGPSKLKQAAALDIPVVTLEEFKKRVA